MNVKVYMMNAVSFRLQGAIEEGIIRYVHDEYYKWIIAGRISRVGEEGRDGG